jgi:hypothetical protein
MHRKQFLRTAAIALPAAMMSPELLFATGNQAATAATKHDFVIINGAAAQKGVISTTGNTVTTGANRVTGIHFTGGQWQVTVKGGRSYLTQKLIINSAGCEATAGDAVQLTGMASPQEVCFGQGRNIKAAKRQEKDNTPQVWMHSHDKLDAHIFTAFLSKARPVLLYVD